MFNKIIKLLNEDQYVEVIEDVKEVNGNAWVLNRYFTAEGDEHILLAVIAGGQCCFWTTAGDFKHYANDDCEPLVMTDYGVAVAKRNLLIGNR